MFKFLIIIFMGSFLSNSIFSQELIIKEEGTTIPIPFVSILDLTSNKWLITDSLGAFNFKPSNFRKLKINALGFENVQIDLKIDTIIYLKTINYRLNDVIVKSGLKTFKSAVYKTQNNRIRHNYRLYGESHLVNYATLFEMKSDKAAIQSVLYNAVIKGNKSYQFVRFKIYKITSIKPIETIIKERFKNSYLEIYAYELKNVYPNPKSKFLKFNLPEDIILTKGYYLFSIQVTPTYNQNQRLELKYSSDPFVHTFHRWDWRVHWVPDYFKMAEGYLNMDVKVEYSPID